MSWWLSCWCGVVLGFWFWFVACYTMLVALGFDLRLLVGGYFLLGVCGRLLRLWVGAGLVWFAGL